MRIDIVSNACSTIKKVKRNRDIISLLTEPNVILDKRTSKKEFQNEFISSDKMDIPLVLANVSDNYKNVTYSLAFPVRLAIYKLSRF